MELFGKSLKEIKEAIADKEVSAVEVDKYFKDRIKKHDGDINSYVTVNEETPEESGEFVGLPLAIKDNHCTKDLRTTASSKVLDTFIPPYDSTVTSRLKKAGFYFNGKTNMDAWAHGSSTETSDYGATKTPWDLGRPAGGSSGGSAAAVSAYLAPASIGSETAGSIRLPSAWCGIVGVKPTYGRVSRYGVVAMGSSLDCPGPMSLNVEDSAMILEVIAGKDPYDATTLDAPVEKYTEEMKKDKKFKIAIVDEYFEVAEESLKVKVEEAVKIFEKMGHSVERVSMLDPQYSISVYTIVQRTEVSSNLGRYHGIRYSGDRTLFGSEAEKRVMLGTHALVSGGIGDLYEKALKVRTLIIDDFKEKFKKYDLIIGPTTPITALPLGEFENYPFFGEKMDELLEPSSLAGLPGMSIPVGLDKNGLPIGMQIIANYLRESDMLNLAFQYERETDYNGVIKQGLDKWK
jgi:aspartyl-tRNA(Asn)/glutamyl-tRNA(Gln) amidotransferase subunit A